MAQAVALDGGQLGPERELVDGALEGVDLGLELGFRSSGAVLFVNIVL